MIFFLTFIFVFGLLVFVHELGHFLVAKKQKVRVEEFGFGFPPRIFGIKKGETLYSLNLIPLGGFVKLYGEAGEGEKSPHSFANLKVGKRILIVLAGVVMNFFLALFLLIGLNLTGAPTGSYEKPVVEAGATVVEPFRVVAASVSKDSPAEKAGIKANDQLISGNGVEFQSAEEVSVFTKANAGKEVELVVKTNGEASRRLLVTLRKPEESPAALGVSPVGIMRVKYPFMPAVIKGFSQVYYLFLAIFVGLGQLIVGLFTSQNVSESVAGPIGIGALLNQSLKLGFAYVLYFMATLSATLSVFNVLPIPALDGGKFFFLALEKIRGKKVKPEIENMVHTVGFIVLLALIVLVSIGDVRKLF